MEVIATKFPRRSTFILILSASLILLIGGLAMFVAFGMISTGDEDVFVYIGLGLMIVGVFTTTLSVISLIRYVRLPQNLMTYESGYFTLPNGEKVEAVKLMDIKYATATPSYKAVTMDMGFGEISFNVDGKKYMVKYTADTVNAYKRICAIVDEQRLSK